MNRYTTPLVLAGEPYSAEVAFSYVDGFPTVRAIHILGCEVADSLTRSQLRTLCLGILLRDCEQEKAADAAHSLEAIRGMENWVEARVPGFFRLTHVLAA